MYSVSRSMVRLIVAAILIAGPMFTFGLAQPSIQVIRSERFDDLKQIIADENDKTLVVFDIDDTLLTSDTFFGSDYWYEWQKDLKNGDTGYVPCRFDIIAINLELGSQRPVEPQAVALVNSIDVDKVFLTARNPGYRPATERELRHSGYQLPVPISKSVDGAIYLLGDADQKREAVVTYYNGIYMVSGLGKGEALAELLRRANRSYEKVILADDNRKNIESMSTAMEKRGISFHGFHYLKVGKSLPPSKELIESAAKEWHFLHKYLMKYSPTRAQQIDSEVCAY